MVKAIPRKAVTSVAIGMILMAVFTIWWSSLIVYVFPSMLGFVVLGGFVLISLALGIESIRVFRLARAFPKSTSPADQAEGKRIGRAYGLIFGIEGAAIGIASGVLGASGHESFIIPVIALIVGLHFYPMAKLFHRTIDYYLATWVCAIALSGIFCVFTSVVSVPQIWAGVGFGVACATTAYGVYMVRYARRLPEPA